MQQSCSDDFGDFDKDALKETAPVESILVQGWVRTRRDSKDFSFIELNDGSCLRNLQIIAKNTLPNYARVQQLITGASIIVRGELVASQGKGQSWEVVADEIEIVGASDDTYPLQKKGHTPEFLREIAHLRPRSNLFGAVFRVRSRLAFAIHQFFQERGFVYVHTPIITGSDCEGAGELFRVTAIDPKNPPRTRRRRDRLREGFLRALDLPDGERTARSRSVRLRALQGLHLWSDVPRRELQHLAARQRVLDDRTGDGVLRSATATWIWPRSS